MALLAIRNVTRRFGGIVAIDDVSLDVEAGQIVGLIGPNGAGKTTLFNVITRLYRPDSGELEFAGKSLRIGSSGAESRAPSRTSSCSGR
jgi:ABC-type branched-subunit amino acid transport system ATPase component